jgi:hypothetical protein
MKNIHLLPTEKPSRLFYNKKDSIFTIDNDFENVIEEDWFQDYNIYITSNEEIKEGDWCLCSEELVHKVVEIKSNIGIIRFQDGVTEVLNACKKIILTTDPELIADGVQAIDDEFLNWFVKNPSCECVEIERMEDGKYIDRFADGTIKEGIYENYKIIIPQEEPKQETLNKINNMGEEIKKQINLLEEEQTRVKQFINENNFNCTTAPWVIAKQYRDEIKKHIGILKMNLEN